MENCSTNSTRSFLIKLGFMPNLRGFDCIETALNLCIEHPTYIFAITKDVYPIVAQKYQSSVSKTERNIRSCISKAEELSNPAFEELFEPYKNCRLTNSLVLSILLEKVKK